MISVSKKGNYGYFYCVHDRLEDFFHFVLHHAEKTPMVDTQCTFLSGWIYDIKAGILNVHCYFIHKRRSNGSTVDM